MKRIPYLALALACGLSIVAVVAAQSHARKNDTDAALRARLTAFLNRTLGWQGLDEMKIESISKPDGSGLRTAKVMLGKGGQHQEGVYYITPDLREIIEGQKSTLSGDPWAATRAQLQLQGAPVTGAANAPVTVVEFSDLECPYCKEEAGAIDQLLQKDSGQVRVVFKYYPLTKIHPWSMQAAEAAVCVTQQHPAQFWNFERAVFAAQDSITTANAAQRLSDFASESMAQPGPYRACLANPATKAQVEASIADGNRVGVVSTPTLFIDGRMVPGAIQASELEMLVAHEAQYMTSTRTSANGAGAGKFGARPAGKQCGACKPLPPIKH